MAVVRLHMIKTKLTKKELLALIESEERRAWELLKAMEDSPSVDTFRHGWNSYYTLKLRIEGKL